MTTQLEVPRAAFATGPRTVVTPAPPRRDRQTLVARAIMAVAALVAGALLWTRRGYIPLWDGRIYADCVIDASRNLLDVGGFRCAEHISHGYVAFLALAQRLAPASPVPMLAMNAALLALGAVALHRIARRVLPDATHAIGRALVVAAFLVHPIILASAVQPGLDFGVLVFTLCGLAAVLEGRRWALVLSGLLLVFSKEPGVLLYGVLAALFLWRHTLRARMPSAPHWLAAGGSAAAVLLNVLHGNFLSALLFVAVLWVVLARRPSVQPVAWREVLGDVRAQWPVVLPLVAVFAYMASHALAKAPAAPGAAAAPVLWGSTGSSALVATVFRAGVIDISTLSVLALMLVVGFVWIPTLITALDVAIAAVRHRRGDAARRMPGVDGAALGIVTAALLGAVWFLSRYQTYSNARYYLPVYPLALVVALASLVRLGASARLRTGIFATLTVLLALSATRTIDPVSRALWGTFAVGDHTMLNTTSLTGECCGAGRDQLVYNLEFTELDALTNSALAAIHPTRATVLVVPPLGDWHTIEQVDATTGRRTLARSGVVRPTTITAPEAYHFAAQIPGAWYFELPYVDNTVPLAKLAERFDVSAPMLVEHGGYTMAIHSLRSRASH